MRIEAASQISFVKRNTLFGESFPNTVQVSKTYVATVDGVATSFRDISDIQGDNFRSDIVGETDDGVVIAAATDGPLGEFKLYSWDGTAIGLKALDTLNRLVDQHQLYDFRTHEIRDNIRVVMQEDNALLMHREKVYQAPLNERTIELFSEESNVIIEDKVFTIYGGSGQSPMTVDTGDQVTLNANENVEYLRLLIHGEDSLPVNGLRFKAPANGTVLISPIRVDSAITYEFSDDLVTLLVGGRKIWIELDGDIRIIESDGIPSESQPPSRDIVLRSSGSSLSFNPRNSLPRGIVSGNSLVTFQLDDDVDVLRLISAAPNQRFDLQSDDSAANRVHLLGGAHGSAELTVQDPESMKIDSMNLDEGTQTILATWGTAKYQFDISRSPLHNPIRAVDADGNNSVTPADILTVINHLADGRGYQVNEDSLFPDVSGDGEISPLDILEVINFLAESQANAPQGEEAIAFHQAALPASSSLDLAISDWQDDEDASEWQRSAEVARLF